MTTINDEMKLINEYRITIFNTGIGKAEFEKFVPDYRYIDNNFWPFDFGANKAKKLDEVNDYFILYTLANNVFCYPNIDTYDAKTTKKLIYTYLDKHPQNERRLLGRSIEQIREALVTASMVAPVDESLIKENRYALPGKFKGKLMSKMQNRHLVSILLTSVQCHPSHPSYHHDWTVLVISELLKRKGII